MTLENPADEAAHPSGKRGADAQIAWRRLLATQAMCRHQRPPEIPFGVRFDAHSAALAVAPSDPEASLVYDSNGKWSTNGAHDVQMHTLLSLYGPLLRFTPSTPFVIGHLGQSLDSRIATATGDAFFVTGTANLKHLHRLRALCDAIVVGAGTVVADNPKLTTRLVSGTHPVRVIVDRQYRLSGEQRLFSDQVAPVLHICGNSALKGRSPGNNVLGIDDATGALNLPAVVSALGKRGLHNLFVEGGGRTVSDWMQAGVLDRLQIAVAPLLVGEGRPAVQLPPAPSMQAALRPPAQLFRMGTDILWDFDLRATGLAPAPGDDDEQEPELQRLW